MLRFTLLLCATVLVVSFASAESYKCVDAAGKPFYSDRPCKERGMVEQKVLKDAPRPTDVPPHLSPNKPDADATKADPRPARRTGPRSQES